MSPDFALVSKILAGVAITGTFIVLVVFVAITAADDDRADFTKVCTELGARAVITDDAWLCVRDGEVVYTD